MAEMPHPSVAQPRRAQCFPVIATFTMYSMGQTPDALSRRTKHKPRESEMQEANEIKLGAMCANAHALGTRGRHETGAGRAIARNPYRNKGKQPATAHETTPYIHRGLSKGATPCDLL